MGNDERRKAAAWAWYERRGGLKEKVEPKPSLGSHSKSGIKSSTSKSLSPSPILEKSRFHAEAVAATASKREWMDESSLYSPPTLPSSSSSLSLLLWDAAEVASFEDLLHRTLVREEYLLSSFIDHSPPRSTSPGSHHSCLPITYLRSITPSRSASSINGGDLGGSEALIDYDLVQHPAYLPEFELCSSDKNWPKEEEEEEEEEAEAEAEEEKRRVSMKRSLGLLRNNWSKKEEEEEEEAAEEEKRRVSGKRSLGLLRNNWSKKEGEEEEEEEAAEEEKRKVSVKRYLGLLRNNWSKKKEEEEEEEHEKRRSGVKRSLGLLWRACENTACRLTHMDLSKAKPGANNLSPYLGEVPEEETQRRRIHCHSESKRTPRRESRNSLRSFFTTQPP